MTTEVVLLTIPAAQAALSVGRSTIYNLINDDKLTVVRIGHAVRVTMSSIRAYVSSLEAGGGMEASK